MCWSAASLPLHLPVEGTEGGSHLLCRWGNCRGEGGTGLGGGGACCTRGGVEEVEGGSYRPRQKGARGAGRGHQGVRGTPPLRNLRVRRS